MMQNIKELSNNAEAIKNSNLIILIRSFISCLQGYKLLDSFSAMKSFKIFVRVLRRENTMNGNIIYTETEQRIYEQKQEYLSQCRNQFKNSIQNLHRIEEEKPVFSFKDLEIVTQQIRLDEKEHKELQKRVEEVSIRSAKVLADFQNVKIEEREQIRKECEEATNLVAQPWIRDINRKREWVIKDLEDVQRFLDQKQDQLTQLENTMRDMIKLNSKSKNKKKRNQQ